MCIRDSSRRSRVLRPRTGTHRPLIRRGYEAFSRGDMKTVGELFADDIVWHNGGRGPFAGDLRSKKEVFELFGELAERSGGTFSIDIHGVVGGDEHVVVLSTSHATTNGRSIESQSADIWLSLIHI